MKNKEYKSINDELNFAQSFRNEFMQYLKLIPETDLNNIWIERKSLNQKRKLSDYLLRIDFHESVHIGLLLSYLRQVRIERPKIWINKNSKCPVFHSKNHTCKILF